MRSLSMFVGPFSATKLHQPVLGSATPCKPFRADANMRSLETALLLSDSGHLKELALDLARALRSTVVEMINNLARLHPSYLDTLATAADQQCAALEGGCPDAVRLTELARMCRLVFTHDRFEETLGSHPVAPHCRRTWLELAQLFDLADVGAVEPLSAPREPLLQGDDRTALLQFLHDLSSGARDRAKILLTSPGASIPPPNFATRALPPVIMRLEASTHWADLCREYDTVFGEVAEGKLSNDQAGIVFRLIGSNCETARQRAEYLLSVGA